MPGLTLKPSRAAPPGGQLPRVALLYLLAVLGAGAGLLSRELPGWITLAAAACVLWRLTIASGRWPFPGPRPKALLVAVICAGIALQYRGSLTLDVYVALLVAGLSLKSLEVYHLRTAQVFLYIAVLALMAYLLYAQDFIATLLAVLQITLIMAALVAVNSDPLRLTLRPFAPLLTAAMTVGLAAPLLVFLFIVMPRLPPLWSMPLQKQATRIGMGEDMRPGDFSRPARSAELAFRAGFHGNPPPQAELYWRGTVLDEFDGRRWKNSGDDRFRWQGTTGPPRPPGQPAYTVVIEPHGRRWVFTLDRARLADERILTNGENLFRYRRELLERASYDVWPAEGAPPVTVMSEEDRRRYTALPDSGNPRSRELAMAWRRATDTDDAIIRRALDLFHQSFYYTLEPPPLGQDGVDGFLFETRRGYCEHYAGAFVFLIRAAGLPARVVMGYQGGQRNAQERYITVRQYDAHAWAEVWREGVGWVRIDPTGAVAPERVEQGFAGLFPDSPAFSTLLGLGAGGRDSLLGYLGIKLGQLDYLLGRWVLGFDRDRQQGLLQRLGLDSPRGLIMAFSAGCAAILGAFLLFLRRRDSQQLPEHPLTARYRQVCAAYARLGWMRRPPETPGQFARRVVADGGPEHRRLERLSRLYEDWSYQPTPGKRREAMLARGLRRLRWRLRWLPSGQPMD